VGTSGGRFLSHRQVRLLALSPNCHGCIIWDGLQMRVLIAPTGFSIAIRGIPLFSNR
jgi:hypothetical protein